MRIKQLLATVLAVIMVIGLLPTVHAAEPVDGEVYTENGYTYKFNYKYNGTTWVYDASIDGWGVIGSTASTYVIEGTYGDRKLHPVKDSINGKYVKNMDYFGSHIYRTGAQEGSWTDWKFPSQLKSAICFGNSADGYSRSALYFMTLGIIELPSTVEYLDEFDYIP